jgi:uncharacterized membrane protein
VRTGRLEAFSDGVIAILITIMVLELRIPQRSTPAALRPLVPVFLTYVLSFVNLGIYWNNHHHMLQATERITARSCGPTFTCSSGSRSSRSSPGWMGENHFATLPTAAYGGVLLLAAIAYSILQRPIVAEQGPESTLAAALGSDLKWKVSLAVYAAGIPLAFVNRWLAVSLYVVVVLLWLLPDRRVESRIRGA